MVAAAVARAAALASSCALAATSFASAQTGRPPAAFERAGYVEASVQPHVTRARMIHCSHNPSSSDRSYAAGLGGSNRISIRNPQPNGKELALVNSVSDAELELISLTVRAVLC